MRRVAEVSIEVVTWLLFAIAVFLLARQTWFAVMGLQPDYSNQQSAFIVAGIVTATWLAMLGRVVLHLDRTIVDWFISLSLLLAGLLIDVAVALSVVLEFTFPTHLALLVIVAHVVAHVIQWIVKAGEEARQRFSGNYVSPEQENIMLKQKLAVFEHSSAMLEQVFEERCSICGEAFEHHTKAAAKRALRAHVGRKHNNGHARQPIPELEERRRIP